MLVTDVLQRALWWMFFVLLSAMSLSRLTRVADAQTPVAKRPLWASTKTDVADGIRFIPWLGANIQSYLASDLEIFFLRYLRQATFISVFCPPGVVFTIIRVTDGTGTLEPVEFVIILAQLQIFSIPGIRWNVVRSQIGIWNVVRLFKKPSHCNCVRSLKKTFFVKLHQKLATCGKC